jgi:hypothetical protein
MKPCDVEFAGFVNTRAVDGEGARINPLVSVTVPVHVRLPPLIVILLLGVFLTITSPTLRPEAGRINVC